MRFRLPTTRQLAAVAAVLAYLVAIGIQFTLWRHGQSVNWVLALSNGLIIAVLLPRAFKGSHA